MSANQNNASAHTPGPWVAKNQRSKEGRDLGWVIQWDNGRIGWASLAFADTNKGHEPECPVNAANARLIAAAPELYEALEEFVGPERDLTEYSCHVGLCTPEECGRCSRELRARTALAKARGEA